MPRSASQTAKSANNVTDKPLLTSPQAVESLPAAKPVASLPNGEQPTMMAASVKAPTVPTQEKNNTTSTEKTGAKAEEKNDSAVSTKEVASSQPATTTTTPATTTEAAPAVRVPVIPVRQSAPRQERSQSSGRNNYSQRRNPYHGGGGYNNNNNNNNGNQRQQQQYADYAEDPYASSPEAGTFTGILDSSREGHGVLRMEMSAEHDQDTFISTSLIRRYRLRPGDVVTGPVRTPKDNERYWGLLKVETVNGIPADEAAKEERPKFKSLTPVYPNEKIKLEIGEEPMSLRIIDLIAPIGKGQRSMLVSPPKAGKTTLLKDIATGVATNHPEIHVMAVLVGERPEEVTDIRRHIARITNNTGEVAASNFDESAEDQCRVAEIALEKAKRMVEIGKDVIILLDSITRLARAYNLAIPTSGRTLSGGFDPAALFPPKKFFGAARNFEVPGSLTIVGTALVETGSRMDDLIYEEFKGTGNQEIQLDRRLAERRIYPAIDVQRSGTRRDDLLMEGITYQSVLTLQRMLDTLDKEERTGVLIEQLRKAKTNRDFLASLKVA